MMKRRAEKDILLVKELFEYVKNRYSDEIFIMDWAERYIKDAEHYLKKGDYFSSFGASNYAYGLLESIIMQREKKGFHEIKKK